jgi:hypothetical protein
MINSVYAPVPYTITSGQTTFNITFEYVAGEHIRANVTDAATGAVTELTNGTGPSSTRFDVVGGDVETVDQHPVGDKLTVYMEMPFLQQTQYLNTGRWDLPTTGNDLDLATLERQQVKDATDRAVKVAVESAETPEELLQSIYDAETAAAASAAAAGVSESAAATSEANAATSEANAEAWAQQANPTNADNITSGNLDAARMPLNGTWNVTSGMFFQYATKEILRFGADDIIIEEGVRVGGASSSQKLDDSTSAGATVPLYIGSEVIDTSVPSDKRLKENITPMPSVLDKIKQVNVVGFNFIDDPKKDCVGVIAQELEPLFPDLIATFKRKEGKTKEEYLRVLYKNFIPYILKAIQELAAKQDA